MVIITNHEFFSVEPNYSKHDLAHCISQAIAFSCGESTAFRHAEHGHTVFIPDSPISDPEERSWVKTITSSCPAVATGRLSRRNGRWFYVSDRGESPPYVSLERRVKLSVSNHPINKEERTTT